MARRNVRLLPAQLPGQMSAHGFHRSILLPGQQQVEDGHMLSRAPDDIFRLRQMRAKYEKSAQLVQAAQSVHDKAVS